MYAPENKWDWEISPKPAWDANIKRLFPYRHLLGNLVRREFLLNYQQTILGPLWILLQPILTLIVYALVFGKLIGIPTGGHMPPVLFYFSGIILWNFFNDSFGGTSNTFRDNIHIFSKVYFPRIIMPLSQLTTHFFRLFIQLLLLLLLTLYYILFRGLTIKFSLLFLAIPASVILTGILSLSLGLIFSVLTAKYRDIANLVFIGIRLLMFVTPVFYALSTVRPQLRWIVLLNPLTPLFEWFRLGWFGEGSAGLGPLCYSVVFISLAFITALYLFTKQGSKLIDVV
ncbi:MAG: ABC transporter permease [Flavisolibacter sp.]